MGSELLRTTAWKRLRAVAAANLPKRCYKCGITIWPGEAFDLCHKIARSQGGAPFDPANLVIGHPRCNRSEGPRLAWQARKQRAIRLADQAATTARWFPPVAPKPPQAPEPSRIW
jgi:5-methylcytosine-specific restriction endonuclease McrA